MVGYLRFFGALAFTALFAASCTSPRPSSEASETSADAVRAISSLADSGVRTSSTSELAPSSTEPTVLTVPLALGPQGPTLGSASGVGTLVIEPATGCVYVDSLTESGVRFFMEWYEGTVAIADGLTTYLGEFIPNGGHVQFHGMVVPVVSDDPQVDVRRTTPPEFLHCLDHASYVMGRGPVRSACLTCTEPRSWPGPVHPSYVDAACDPPMC